MDQSLVMHMNFRTVTDQSEFNQSVRFACLLDSSIYVKCISILGSSLTRLYTHKVLINKNRTVATG